MIELVGIQKFMYLIGGPLYPQSTVIIMLLQGAGIRSAAPERIGV